MIDLNELTRRLLKSFLNATVDLQADELPGEGTDAVTIAYTLYIPVWEH